MYDFKNAPKKSKEAKQVKLADKLYNLRDLNRCVPDGWDTERVENYFIWAQKVVNGLRNGLNLEGLHFSWLNIKGIDAAFSIAISRVPNHLK